MSHWIDFAGRHECKDDELAGWFNHLNEEFLGTDSRKGFLVVLDAKLKDCKRENYESIRKDVEISFNQLSKDLRIILGVKDKGTLSPNDVVEMKDKLKNFDEALTKMKDLIGEEMYDSKLNCFFLNLERILRGIVNFFLDRDLHYYQRSIVGEGFVFNSAGPAFYKTPVYILPDRPQISLFFSEQISNNIDTIEKKLPQFNRH